MKSKTLIDKQLKRKNNPELVETILKAKKLKDWLQVARILSGTRIHKVQVNLDKIDRESKEGDSIVVPGKVLGNGEVNKKLRIIAISFSESAVEKLKNKKCETRTILEEIKSNPKAQGVKIVK